LGSPVQPAAGTIPCDSALDSSLARAGKAEPYILDLLERLRTDPEPTTYAFFA